jgi:glyoxylase-like metal-dependent hydrolase (beta-lactamase superfamily II)
MLADAALHAVSLTLFSLSVTLGKQCSTKRRESTMSTTPQRAGATFTLNGRDVTVHALQTGTVTVKRLHQWGRLPEGTPAGLRFAAILADRRFADPMPVWSFAIGHPEGLFVVDAGADPGYDDPATWQGHVVEHRFIRSFIRLDVPPAERLAARLGAIGHHPGDVRALVLTHQHVDHTAGVAAFPSADIWTTKAEDAVAARIGAMTWRWRDANTRIRHVDAEGRSGALGQTTDLTSDGSLQAVHTPGHTPGSVSVVLRADQGEVWFSGDTSFTAAGMNPSAPTAGIHTDMRAVRRLHAALRDRYLLLPSHDPGVPARLAAAGRAMPYVDDRDHWVPAASARPLAEVS